MSEAESTGPYRCPLCRVPAPSVAACKIHISRKQDTVHVGYEGKELHEEIVTGQVVQNPTAGDRSPVYAVGRQLVSSLRRMVREMLAIFK